MLRILELRINKELIVVMLASNSLVFKLIVAIVWCCCWAGHLDADENGDADKDKDKSTRRAISGDVSLPTQKTDSTGEDSRKSLLKMFRLDESEHVGSPPTQMPSQLNRQLELNVDLPSDWIEPKPESNAKPQEPELRLVPTPIKQNVSENSHREPSPPTTTSESGQERKYRDEVSLVGQRVVNVRRLQRDDGQISGSKLKSNNSSQPANSNPIKNDDLISSNPSTADQNRIPQDGDSSTSVVESAPRSIALQPISTRSTIRSAPRTMPAEGIRFQFSDEAGRYRKNQVQQDEISLGSENENLSIEDQVGLGDEAEADDLEEPSDEDSESIESQRAEYRAALLRPLSAAPLQLALSYVDDEGKTVPASVDQKSYLTHFNGYRGSPYGDGQLRIDMYGCIWYPSYMVWKSPDICYGPLYFEEVNLERFGGRYPVMQPAISAVHFFSNTVRLPYSMGLQPPHRCYYSAGYGRPGNKYCYQLQRPVWSLKGASFQALLVTGIVFALP